MTMTIDVAFKTLKKIQSELEVLRLDRRHYALYTTEEGKQEADRPDFSMEDTAAKIEECTRKIVVIKHAINKFNSEHILFDDVTIDKALVLVSIYNNEAANLGSLCGKKEKERAKMNVSGVAEYVYRNYSAEFVEQLYKKFTDEVVRIQSAINVANVTCTIDVDI